MSGFETQSDAGLAYNSKSDRVYRLRDLSSETVADTKKDSISQFYPQEINLRQRLLVK